MPGGRILELQEADLQVDRPGPAGRQPDRPAPLLHLRDRLVGRDAAGARTRAPRRRDRPARLRRLREAGLAATRSKTRRTWSAQALSRLGVRDATVAGHSLGGTVATALAERSPELVERLVIVDQAPNNDDFEKRGCPSPPSSPSCRCSGPALWRVIPDSAIKDGLGAAFAPGYDVPDAFVDDFRRMTYTSYDAAVRPRTTTSATSRSTAACAGAGLPRPGDLRRRGAALPPAEGARRLRQAARLQTALDRRRRPLPERREAGPDRGLVLDFTPSGAKPRQRVQEAVQNEKPVRPRP